MSKDSAAKNISKQGQQIDDNASKRERECHFHETAKWYVKKEFQIGEEELINPITPEKKKQEMDKEETCPVCLDTYDKQNLRKLVSCEHYLCDECLVNVTRTSSLCPICRKPFGVVKGNQPENGEMNVITDSNTWLPGFSGCGAIIITYTMHSGVQTDAHPKPGKPFYGTVRRAFLPNNEEGKKACRLLKKAFDARLVFTVGRSITTGIDDVVTWNDIHHKTSITGGPENYGYPDNTYLVRLIEDLAARGITE